MRTWIVVSLLALVHGANECSAATMSLTQSTGNRTDFAGGLDFSQFDPALGTLTQVTYSSFLILTPTTGVQNSGATRSFFATASGIFQYKIPGVNASGDFPGNPRRFDVNSETRTVPSGAFVNLPYASFTRFLPDNTFSSGSSAFSSYIGTGSFHLDYSYLYNVITTPSSGVSLDAGLINSLTGTVTYTYTVPEPASLTLGITVMLAFLCVTTRRRKQNQGLGQHGTVRTRSRHFLANIKHVTNIYLGGN